MDTGKPRVLIVDDDHDHGAVIDAALTRDGFAVDATNDAFDAIELFQTRTYHLVIAEVRLLRMAGLRVVAEAKKTQRDTQFILMTSGSAIDWVLEAVRGGAYDYLTKPVDLRRLRVLVGKALEFQKVVAENHALRRRLPEPPIGIEGQADPLTLRAGESATCAIHPGMTIAECEKLLIRQTLVHATPNRERAARLLGISRRALQYKLKSYGLLTPKRDATAAG